MLVTLRKALEGLRRDERVRGAVITGSGNVSVLARLEGIERARCRWLYEELRMPKSRHDMRPDRSTLQTVNIAN